MSDWVNMPNLNVRGTLKAGAFTIPNGAVGDDQVSASSPIDADKLQHRHHKSYGQSGTATAVTIPIHVANAAGTIVAFRAGSNVIAIGDSTVTVALHKNGSTLMSSALTLDNANTARVLEDGSLSSASYAADDFFSIVVTVSAGTGTLPTGLYVELIVDESPA